MPDRDDPGLDPADAAEVLRHLRGRIGRLEREDGRFAVACEATGVRPAPVTDATFGTYADAARAGAAARSYREALRAVDPGVERYDLRVCEVDDGSLTATCVRERTGDRRANGLPRARQSVTLAGETEGAWLRVENAPVVHLAAGAEPLDDELVTRQLDSKLRR